MSVSAGTKLSVTKERIIINMDDRPLQFNVEVEKHQAMVYGFDTTKVVLHGESRKRGIKYAIRCDYNRGRTWRDILGI